MKNILNDLTAKQILKMYYYNVLSIVFLMVSPTNYSFINSVDDPFFNKISEGDKAINFINRLGNIIYDPYSEFASDILNNESVKKQLKRYSDRLMTDTFNELHTKLTKDFNVLGSAYFEILKLIGRRFEVNDRTANFIVRNFDCFIMVDPKVKNLMALKLHNELSKIDKYSPLLSFLKQEANVRLDNEGVFNLSENTKVMYKFIFILVIAFFISTLVSKKHENLDESQRQEKIHEQEIQQENIKYFKRNSSKILSRIRHEIKVKNYKKAVDISSKYLASNNKELITLHGKALRKLSAINNAENMN